jgi:hypothetical protein
MPRRLALLAVISLSAAIAWTAAIPLPTGRPTSAAAYPAGSDEWLRSLAAAATSAAEPQASPAAAAIGTGSAAWLAPLELAPSLKPVVVLPLAAPSADPTAAPTAKPEPRATPRATPRPTPAPKPAATPKPTAAATPKPAPTAEPKPTPESYTGTSRFWYPALGINAGWKWYGCEYGGSSSGLGAGVYRWGCGPSSNIYLMSHAWSTFEAIRRGYHSGRLKVGQPVWYADKQGKVSEWQVKWIKRVDVDYFNATAGEWALNSSATPIMTLQTCDGAQSQYRIIVRLVPDN